MNEEQINILGRYNAEKARGLIHTSDWKFKMMRLQHEFDLEQLEQQIPTCDQVGHYWIVGYTQTTRQCARCSKLERGNFTCL